MTLRVYTKPSCPGCVLTKKLLAEPTRMSGITCPPVDFEEIDITEDDDAYAFITNHLGYQAAPVVYVSDDIHWSGFKPDHIKEFIFNAEG